LRSPPSPTAPLLRRHLQTPHRPRRPARVVPGSPRSAVRRRHGAYRAAYAAAYGAAAEVFGAGSIGCLHTGMLGGMQYYASLT